MKQIMIFGILLFLSVISTAQNTICQPQEHSEVRFNYPPTHSEYDPQLTPPPPLGPPSSDLRGIYWVHGLGGDASSMAQIAAATDYGVANYPARKTVGMVMNYVQTGLVAAGSDLNQKMITYDGVLKSYQVNDFSRNFIISHSQGGLASRMADKLLDQQPETARRHYGIVTIGSPHLGARIVNSRNDGLIQEFASDACEAVLSAELADILGQFPLLDVFIDLNNQQQNLQDLCEGASGAILPFALNNLFSGASNDYAVGAPVLAELQGHNNGEIHKTSFYGVEYARPGDDPSDNGFLSKQLIWRMLGTLPDEVSNAPVFGANEDQELVDKANANMANYQSKYEQAELVVRFYEDVLDMPCNFWEWLGHPAFCAVHEPGYQDALDRRAVYYNALRWSQTVDSQWKIIIGAKERVVSEATCECIDMDTDEEIIVPGIVSSIACHDYEMDHPNLRCKWYVTHETLIHESDGVVNAETQQGFPGSSGSYRMNYANHFQERNSEPTREALIELFENGNGDGWFVTLPK